MKKYILFLITCLQSSSMLISSQPPTYDKFLKQALLQPPTYEEFKQKYDHLPPPYSEIANMQQATTKTSPAPSPAPNEQITSWTVTAIEPPPQYKRNNPYSDADRYK
jgi:hypothetical protein